MSKKESKIVGKYRNYLSNKNYAECTIRSYSKSVSDFIKSLHKNPYKLNKVDLEEYLLNYDYSSVSNQNQIISSLKLFYTGVLNISLNKITGVERPRRIKPLPKVIDKDYLLTSIGNIQNIKHKAIISLAYSVGLRVSEVCNLKIEDIDSKRMSIHIRDAKGNKDRYVPLSSNVLKLLRLYFREYKPKEYLFNGQNRQQYSHSSCNKIVKKYIGSKNYFHQLRHSAFTNLTEEGVDIHAIQKLAGHSSPKTTQIYLQVSTKVLNNLPLAI